MLSEATVDQRAAFHRITCLNGRDPLDMAIILPLVTQIQDR